MPYVVRKFVPFRRRDVVFVHFFTTISAEMVGLFRRKDVSIR